MKKRGFEWIKSYSDTSLPLPQRSTAHSAGYDLASVIDVILKPNEVTLVPTGLKAYMQDNEYLGIHIRSSLAVKKHICLINSQGIIDGDYYNNADNEGHIFVALLNFGMTTINLPKYTRIAQGIFYHFLVADDDTAAAERTGGFGSTGQ
jgi:dUTP pyrophosphatase